MVQIDPEGLADQGARFREERRGKSVPARARLVRAGPADRRPGTGQDGQRPARSRGRAGRGLEAGKSGPGPERRRRTHGRRRRGLSRRLDRGRQAAPRHAFASPRSTGWPSSSATRRTEELLRTAWTNPKEAYGARTGRAHGAGRLESQGRRCLADRRTQDLRRSSLDRRDGARAHAGDARTEGPRAGRALQSVRPAGRAAIRGRRRSFGPWPRTTRPCRTSWSRWSAIPISSSAIRRGARSARSS